MRILLLAACILISTSVCIAQYTVTKVVGKVKNTTNGEMLKTGSKMSETDKLQFSGPSDLVRLIVLGKGTFVLQANPKAYEKESTVMEILKSSFHLNSKEGYLSGRAVNVETVPDAFETEVDYSDKNRIGPVNLYLFSEEDFPTNDGSRFFLQISTPGKSPVNHPLKTIKDTLILLDTDFSITGNTDLTNAEYKIGYFSKPENRSRSVASFKPYFDITHEMEEIIKVMISINATLDKSILQKECYKEIYEALGKPSDILFTRVFNEYYSKVKEK